MVLLQVTTLSQCGLCGAQRNNRRGKRYSKKELGVRFNLGAILPFESKQLMVQNLLSYKSLCWTYTTAIPFLVVVGLGTTPQAVRGDSFPVDTARFVSALERADAALANGNLFWGKIWLRQAYQTAPNSLAKADVEQILRRVSQANPLSVDLKFSFSPSNNVNDGSETGVIWIGDLPFELDLADREIPGYRAETSVSVAYRFSQSDFAKSELLGDFYFRNVWIDSPVSEASPDLDGSDHNVTNYSLGIRTTMLAFPELGPSELTGLLGQTWRGGDVSSNWVEIRASQTFKMSGNSLVRTTVGARKNSRLDSASNDSTGLTASIDWQRSAQDGTFYVAGAFAESVTSSSPLIDSRAIGINANILFPEVYKVNPSAQIKIEKRNFDNWSVGTIGRTDISWSTNFAFDLVALNSYGFSPVVNLGYRKVSSTVDIFDREGFTFGVSVSSKF